ncbi:hypothetical protein K1719_010062 [Acacia pycnantha]|nr:hypothetical protein K1719_010062 [Acacia pycnantha]
MEKVTRLASEKEVVIFSKTSCCLCHSVKVLFQQLLVKPKVYEIDLDPEGREMEKALVSLGCSTPVPAVFIGGIFVGSTNQVMSLHLSGTLTQLIQPYKLA